MGGTTTDVELLNIQTKLAPAGAFPESKIDGTYRTSADSRARRIPMTTMPRPTEARRDPWRHLRRSAAVSDRVLVSVRTASPPNPDGIHGRSTGPPPKLPAAGNQRPAISTQRAN